MRDWQLFIRQDAEGYLFLEMVRQQPMSFKWDKFKALVHYICEKAENPSVLGAVKLNKVLWYSDTIHYLTTGQPITGETYVKRQRGPSKEGKIACGHVDHFGFTKHEYVSIHEADKSIFSGEEIALIDRAFEHVCINHTARSVSEETHNVIWELAELGEEMPYYTIFASGVGEIDEADIAWANEVLSAA
jgi:hypothetical protein